MALLVHKYGGTSLSTAQRIRDIAARLAHAKRQGHDLVVVVSAMAGATNQLLSLAHEISRTPDPRELDMLLTTGERVTMSLMAMALKATGLDSISLTGSQSGIITDTRHTRARIVDVRGDRIQEALDRGRIVIVAGFQGVSPTREVTTLGRGGSDVTAVAIAARFKATLCDIYTDVDGVYSANPGRIPTARRIERLDHDSMVTYARLGAGVVHPRAATLARRDRVPLRILSSFIPGRGTEVLETTSGVPPVIGIGAVREVLRVAVDGPASEFQGLLDDSNLPLLAAQDRGDRTVLFVEAGGWTDVAEELVARDRTPEVSARGTLVSVVTRADVDVREACAEPIPADGRAHPELGAIPGALLGLVEPDRADAIVLDMHRTLVEEGLAATYG